MDEIALHGLSCRKSQGRHPRHAAINMLLQRASAAARAIPHHQLAQRPRLYLQWAHHLQFALVFLYSLAHLLMCSHDLQPHATITSCNLHWWCFPLPTRHFQMFTKEHLLQHHNLNLIPPVSRCSVEVLITVPRPFRETDHPCWNDNQR